MDKHVFESIKTIAIVGLSDDKTRPSFEVGKYLKSQGFTIIPVNPNIKEWEGIKTYPNLLSIPRDIQIDIVDIFRKSEAVLPIVQEAVERGDVKTIWMQEGVENKEAGLYAKNRGLDVVMNFCLMKAHKKLS